MYFLSYSICEAFKEINRIAITAPLSTKEMIELGEYMLHVKNKRMVQLNVSTKEFLIRYQFWNLFHAYIYNFQTQLCNYTVFYFLFINQCL